MSKSFAAPRVFPWRSLKTRITLSTLAIFLAGIWSLSFYASDVLRDDMTAMLGEQQVAAVSSAAAAVDSELEQRLRPLGTLATMLTHVAPDQWGVLQSYLDASPELASLFNGGFIVYGLDGVPKHADGLAVGIVPGPPVAAEVIQAAFQRGESNVGRPSFYLPLQAPVFPVAVPIVNAEGAVVGVLVGLTNLHRRNFLDRITDNRYAKTGATLFAVPASRQIITASDKARILETLPAAGADPLTDYILQDHEGFNLMSDRQGAEVLVSSKRISQSGWTVAAVLSTDVAFAPIRTMQHRMLLATLVLTLLAGVLTWWILRRQLAPMLEAVHTLARLSDPTLRELPLQPLAIQHNDEVGELIGGLNHLLATLGQREHALRDSEERFRTLVEWSPEAVVVHVQDRIVYANPAAALLLGATSPQDLVGRLMAQLLHPESLALAHQRARYVAESGQRVGVVALRFIKLDGSLIDVEVQGTPIQFDGAKAVHTVLSDITGRKLAEIELRIAATAFESQQGMLVTDRHWQILRVNQAFCDITGYSAEEAVGQTPSDLLRSGLHDADFFQAMASSLEHTGTWQGEVWDRRKNGELFPGWFAITAIKDEHDQVTHYVDTFTDITDRKAAEEQIQNLAFFDPLTGLPNRRLLMDRLALTMANHARDKRSGALLFVDLDNFKTLNDSYGHHVGDLLLQEVARRLSTCIRKGDTVARLGGDEFVVMLEDLGQQAMDAVTHAEAVGDKILAVLNQNFLLAGTVHHSTPSIGITLFGEMDESIEEPLKRADLAMYQAKSAGRNTLRFFDPHMQAVVSARAALEMGLREALVSHQLELYYQPQIVGEAQLTGVEALVRWQHPERGMVPPAEFIPLAEDTGLILPLGLWVLETACAQLALWARQRALAHLTMAVNVSPRQFQQSDFVDQVLAVLARTGARPQRLKLELTESMLVDDIEGVITKMDALKAVGVGFSLDDFGTGYSSLSYLKLLPLDQLKIDQGFVRDILTDPNDAAIAKMVIALGDSLGLAVMAEGVETEAQRLFLAHQGCHAYQGYLFSCPLAIVEFEAFVGTMARMRS
ncbi:MAG: EAL domain-containing protein [Rhodoferax sp.]|uniref:bifunctional diguanylate cyclase/phosphodiesterase n=1 Tax=Rhodoferax sp. TaxID=50421 RepID=UPI003267B204